MQKNRTHRLALTALCVTLTIVSARISIPIPGLSVVFSAQMCVVLCAGLLLGPRYGTLSQAVYLLLGLIGLPVFTLGGGPAYVLRPSFAYLLGFPAAAGVCGWVTRRAPPPSFSRLGCAGLAGVAALYAVALPALWVQARLTAGQLPAMGVFLASYCLAFLPMDVAKAALAAAICRSILRRMPGLSYL